MQAVTEKDAGETRIFYSKIQVTHHRLCLKKKKVTDLLFFSTFDEIACSE
jgi:hypothetical protein